MKKKTTGYGVLLLVALSMLSLSAGAADSQIVASGEFEGRSDHEVSGTVSILKMGDRTVVVLGPDFELDGAPDPKVALGKNGYDPATLLEPLVSKEGAQVYEFPASVRAEGYNEVWIWCEKFDVPLGVAFLEPADLP